MANKGLGRRFAPDQRDLNFPIRAAFPAKLTRSYRYHHDASWWGDQGDYPHCVAYAGVKYLEDGPVTFDGKTPNPRDLYRVLQQNDEWPGEGYDGTSVRALGRVLSDVALLRTAGIATERPLVSEYRWAFDAVEVAIACLTVGPVVMGTNWYWSFGDPDAKGWVRIDGGIAGGHAWLITGVRIELKPGGKLNDPTTWDPDRSFVRCANSWGRGWGKDGRFYMNLTTLDRLIHEEGEAMLAVEEPSPGAD